MDTRSALELLSGFILLIAGGELLVRCASRLATSFGVSPLVVGLTVVALGTSAPELVVSVVSSWRGSADIAYGNVVGSNICNILLILGLSALIAPLGVDRKLVRVDTPIMIAAAALAFVCGLDGRVGRVDGLILVTLLVGYTAWSVRSSLSAPRAVEKQMEREFAPRKLLTTYGRPLLVLLIVAALGVLILGSNLFVSGAVAVARSLGVSELVIGLTVVAVGTSMPELVTSIVAALRGERDIAVGNVVGSSIFNVLGVLGASGLLAPNGVSVSKEALWGDTLLMVAACAACWPMFFSAASISRLEGLVLLSFYVTYVGYLVLDAQQHALAPRLAHVVLWYALPATAVGLVLFSWRSRVGARQRA